MSQSTVDTDNKDAYVAGVMKTTAETKGLGSDIMDVCRLDERYLSLRKDAISNLLEIAGVIGYGVISGGQKAQAYDTVIEKHDYGHINAASCLLILQDIRMDYHEYQDEEISDLELDVFHGLLHCDFKAASDSLQKLIGYIQGHSHKLRRQYGSWMIPDGGFEQRSGVYH